ncbi:MAG: phosphoribosylglycinamide formyltransferase [Ignavibacteriales bacterium CG_4_9_14_3_um_filter_30_11]|nr:MAG: phosphoribosylglycinamide formyltransferase [Ignavibacteriales bacterium CG_4_9_14_3_um_filter_30_11]
MLRLTVFVSGRGSNLKSILDYFNLNNKVEIKLIVTDNSLCKALDIAKQNNIPFYCIDKKNSEQGFEYLIELLKNEKVELIVLAGFLKLLSSSFVSNFKQRIINIHPALLPAFGGEGMYGINVHKAVFQSGDKISGATIHFVDETYDTGNIIAQEKVDISECKTPEEIAAKVLTIEHQLLPKVINDIVDGKIVIGN